ncbi:FAD-dependent oxidoreductase [Anaerobacillus sp. MEB173]|uniref:FAD-dependent oxidoreductase n=1 Tax=Anaerobacillus sp. MEB173 TaxID=3383345 RepID=UPI003F91CAB8
MKKNKKVVTKEKIISSAILLFKEKGFEQTTVKEITDLSEVAKGTFFNYFPTKDSILESLAEERLELALLHIQQISHLTFIQQIKNYLNFLLQDYEQNQELTVKIWTHAIQSESALLDQWKFLLLRAVKKEEINHTICTEQWSHILNSLLHYGLVKFSHPTSKNQLLQQIMQLILPCLEGIIENRGSVHMEKLVILGGGYGGMRILQRLLTNDLPKNIEITLIDKMPYHCLKTEFYALAAGTESDQHLRVSYPKDPRLHVKFATVSSVDIDTKLVHLENDEPIAYDNLIIGLGCEDKYHNVPGAPEHTLSIQSMEATRRTFEVISNLRPNAAVSIVGAGLSGVELASELRESRPDLTIRLFDRGEIILSMFPKRLSNYVHKWFIENNVDVINKSNITKVEENILYNHDEPIENDAIIWTAGIQPNKVVRDLDVEKDDIGRVRVTNHHHLPNNENVFVVGDCASYPHAPSAQLAEGQGEQIVTILKKRWNGEPLPETMPNIKLKGVLGSLGKKHGFGMMGERALIGRVPRVLKTGVLWMYKYHTG